MKTTYLFIAALCLTACTKPVSAPVPDLPAEVVVKETIVVAPPAVEVAPAADIAAPAALSPDAAPTLPASPESAPVEVAPVK
jgi:hypothetical protein